jgi:hypothetical protein
VSPRLLAPSCTSPVLRSLAGCAVWPYWFDHPSMTFGPCGLGLRGFPAHPGYGQGLRLVPFFLPWTWLCSRVLPGPGRLLRGILSWGSPPLQRMQHREATYAGRSTARLCCVFRLSQPPDAFFLPEPSGPVSCRWRSWGSALQRFAPPVSRVHISVSLPLLAFRSTRRRAACPSFTAGSPRTCTAALLKGERGRCGTGT